MTVGPFGEAIPQQPVSAFFYGQRGRRVTPASGVSRRTREREIGGYLAANPGASRDQARRATADMRRRGYVPKFGQNPTPEQSALSGQYQERSQRSREAAAASAAAAGKGPIRVVAYEFGPGVGFVENLNKHDRSVVGRYWNAIDRYLKTGDSGDWTNPVSVNRRAKTIRGLNPRPRTFRGLWSFDNYPIAGGTLHLVGDPDIIDMLFNQDPNSLYFEDIYGIVETGSVAA